MQVSVVFFARLKREIGAEISLDLPEGATVRELAAVVQQQYGVDLKGCMVAVNEAYSTPDQSLSGGDEVAFLPPVSGGSGETTTIMTITGQPLKLDDAAHFLVQPQYGAQAYFVGTVRSPNAGKKVDFIDYEGYEALAQKVMQEAAAQARQQHGDLRIVIQHRTGRLYPGEASILIGVASPHRRAALEACDLLIEYLKVHIPVWKHEQDESGSHWVSGQTGHETV